MDLLTQLTALYQDAFHASPIHVCSPGRVNLIGEHTDYNEGFVLPAAIDKAIYLAVGPRSDKAIHLIAHDLQETHVGSLDDIKPVHTWADYILGVVAQLRMAGHELGGFNCVLAAPSQLARACRRRLRSKMA